MLLSKEVLRLIVEVVAMGALSIVWWRFMCVDQQKSGGAGLLAVVAYIVVALVVIVVGVGAVTQWLYELPGNALSANQAHLLRDGAILLFTGPIWQKLRSVVGKSPARKSS